MLPPGRQTSASTRPAATKPGGRCGKALEISRNKIYPSRRNHTHGPWGLLDAFESYILVNDVAMNQSADIRFGKKVGRLSRSFRVMCRPGWFDPGARNRAGFTVHGCLPAPGNGFGPEPPSRWLQGLVEFARRASEIKLW